ncbi:peptide chain release factor 1 [Janibacter sp. DB-40]|uniref:peptide chain release factor 1 n=1 Tax=Janibacter sp. DB-40 TaxID=3028808 RepID=UPI0024066C50|nr:peptide chain release factor 1 [Janibacter sp. DB-40]
MLESVEALLTEHAELEAALADPAVIGDPDRLREVNQRYARLTPIVTAHRAHEEIVGDLEAARELAGEDPAFAEEIPALESAATEAEDRLRRLLIPRDPDDDNDVILEIKAGEGGAESALFAGDLLRMYLRHAEKRGWGTQILDSTESDLGGYKDVRVAVSAKGTPEPGEAPWARLKYEGGVHRVQRVPVTESQGRIHTSAAGVWVMPDIGETAEVEIGPNDLKIDVYRSSGPGGQSVNTTDSAVRITHLPTGTVVSCQNEKSQLQNKESALRVLRARLHQMAVDEAAAEAAETRASQVRTVDRSERIRTYNYPENRISDHRTGYKAHHLDSVLDGDLDAVIDSAVEADEAARLGALSGGEG